MLVASVDDGVTIKMANTYKEYFIYGECIPFGLESATPALRVVAPVLEKNLTKLMRGEYTDSIKVHECESGDDFMVNPKEVEWTSIEVRVWDADTGHPVINS